MTEPTIPKANKEDKARVKREEVLKEIVATEHSYVDGLAHLILNYVHPLKNPPIISDKLFDECFGLVLSIHDLNTGILAQMQQAHSNPFSCDSDLDSIPKVFQKRIQDIRSYSPFVNKYDQILQTIKNLKKENKQFCQFMEEMEVKAKSEGFLGFFAYFVTPIQRPPRYILLFKELLKNTPNGHEEYDIIVSVLKEAETVCNHINSTLRKSEHKRKYDALMENLRGVEQSKLYLLAPEVNQILFDGELQMLNETNIVLAKVQSTTAIRMILLTSIILIIKKDKCQEFIELDRSVVPQMIDLDPSDSQFTLATAEKSFNFKALSRQIKNSWIKAFNTAMLNLEKTIPELKEAPRAEAKKRQKRKTRSFGYADIAKSFNSDQPSAVPAEDSQESLKAPVTPPKQTPVTPEDKSPEQVVTLEVPTLGVEPVVTSPLEEQPLQTVEVSVTTSPDPSVTPVEPTPVEKPVKQPEEHQALEDPDNKQQQTVVEPTNVTHTESVKPALSEEPKPATALHKPETTSDPLVVETGEPSPATIPHVVEEKTAQEKPLVLEEELRSTRVTAQPETPVDEQPKTKVEQPVHSQPGNDTDKVSPPSLVDTSNREANGKVHMAEQADENLEELEKVHKTQPQLDANGDWNTTTSCADERENLMIGDNNEPIVGGDSNRNETVSDPTGYRNATPIDDEPIEQIVIPVVERTPEEKEELERMKSDLERREEERKQREALEDLQRYQQMLELEKQRKQEEEAREKQQQLEQAERQKARLKKLVEQEELNDEEEDAKFEQEMKKLAEDRRTRMEEERKRDSEREEIDKRRREREAEFEAKRRLAEQDELERRRQERLRDQEKRRRQREDEELERKSIERSRIKRQLERLRGDIKHVKAQLEATNKEKDNLLFQVKGIEDEKSILVNKVASLQARVNDRHSVQSKKSEILSLEVESQDQKNRIKANMDAMKRVILDEQSNLEHSTEIVEAYQYEAKSRQEQLLNLSSRNTCTKQQVLRAKDDLETVRLRILGVSESCDNLTFDNSKLFKEREQMSMELQRERATSKKLKSVLEEILEEMNDERRFLKDQEKKLKVLVDINHEIKRNIVDLSRHTLDFTALDSMKKEIGPLRTNCVMLAMDLKQTKTAKEDHKPEIEQLKSKMNLLSLKEEDMSIALSHANKRLHMYSGELLQKKLKADDISNSKIQAEKRHMEAKKTVTLLREESQEKFKILQAAQLEKEVAKRRAEELEFMLEQQQAKKGVASKSSSAFVSAAVRSHRK